MGPDFTRPAFGLSVRGKQVGGPGEAEGVIGEVERHVEVVDVVAETDEVVLVVQVQGRAGGVMQPGVPAAQADQALVQPEHHLIAVGEVGGPVGGELGSDG